MKLSAMTKMAYRNKAMVDKQDYGSTGVSPALGKEDGAPSGMTLCWKWPGGEQVNGY